MLVNILVLLSLLSLTLGFVHNGHNSIRSLRSSLIMKDAKYQLVLLRHGIIFISYYIILNKPIIIFLYSFSY